LTYLMFNLFWNLNPENYFNVLPTVLNQMGKGLQYREESYFWQFNR
jgi:hypothetical protein